VTDLVEHLVARRETDLTHPIAGADPDLTKTATHRDVCRL
jgi:hypothetical protein